MNNDKKYFARFIAPAGAGTMLALAPLFTLAPWTIALLWGILGVSTADWALSHFSRNKVDKFFEKADYFGGDLPELVKENKTENGYICEYKFPAGVSMTMLEKIKEPLEMYLNAYVSLSFDKNVFIEVNEKKLKTQYDYEFINSVGLLEYFIGHDRNGKFFYNLETAPHLLIGATPGGGKSCLLRVMEMDMVLKEAAKDSHTPKCNLHFIDFQGCECAIFDGCKFVKLYYTPQEFEELLDKLAIESARRISEFRKLGVVNIQGYNEKSKIKLPYHVIVIDEFSSLMATNNEHIFKKLLLRLSGDRKVGHHIIISTQRPTVDIIPGSLKALIPDRIGLRCATGKDSETVIDERGCEDLRGNGHALFKHSTVKEFQTLWLDEKQVSGMIAPYVSKHEKPKLQVIRNANRKRQKNNPIY